MVETRLILEIAEETSTMLARRTVAQLQRMKKPLLLGEDSGLANVWDEICVQIQGYLSFHWDAYDHTVHALVSENVRKLPAGLCRAIWLQTDEGEDWFYEQEGEDSALDIPYNMGDVVRYVVGMVYQLAAEWSNPRIRRYLGQ